MKIKITNTDRIISSILTITGSILFFVAVSLMAYFVIDKDLFEQVKLSRMSVNSFFSICDFLGCEKNSMLTKILTKLIFNTSLISLFWFQHILMANNRFKMFLTNFSNYPTYERGLFIFRMNIYSLIFSI